MEPFDLNQIHISSPCTVSWATMTGDERARFCKLCKLNVYNVSEMNKTEAEDLIRISEGKVCLRLVRRRDGTVLTRDCTPIRTARMRRRVSAMVATAILFGLQGVTWLERRRAESADHNAKRYNSHISAIRLQKSELYTKSKAVQEIVDWAEKQVAPPATPSPTPNVWRGIAIYE